MASISRKRGDSFNISLVITDPANGDAIVDISSWTITSQMRKAKKLTQNFTVTITDGVNGAFMMEAPNTDTLNWDIGTHQCDIEFIHDGGTVTSSETFFVEVIEDITYGN